MPSIAEIRSQFPMYSDMPDGELVRGLHSKFYADMPYASFLKSIDFAPTIDPTKDMSGTQKFLAGAGKGFVDMGRGAGQIMGQIPQAEIDESKRLDKPLMNTGAGLAGNITSNAAMLAPTAFIPGANTYTGAATIGALSGALQPTETGESRGANAALSGGAGVLGQAAGNAIGRVLRPVATTLDPAKQRLADIAKQEGIPLTAGQQTGSRPLQVAESVMENLPLTSGPQLAGREAQQRAFTAAALRRGGIAAEEAAPDVLATQKTALGKELGRIAKGNTLDFNQGLVGDLAKVTSDAAKRGKTAAEPITSIVDNILAEVNQAGKMTGENYQAWRQLLRPLAQGGGPEAHYYDQIRKSLDSAFNTQIATTGGADAWKGANRQYANLKTLMQAAGGPGATAASNQIAPTQLAAALRNAVGKEGVALGRGDLNDLSRVGTTFVKDQIPNSGTAQRQLMQALLTGSGGAGVGGGTAMMMGKDPLEGAAYGAGIGGSVLLAPKLAQILMNSKAGQGYLTKGAVALTPAERKALSATIRSLTIGAAQATQ